MIRIVESAPRLVLGYIRGARCRVWFGYTVPGTPPPDVSGLFYVVVLRIFPWILTSVFFLLFRGKLGRYPPWPGKVSIMTVTCMTPING